MLATLLVSSAAGATGFQFRTLETANLRVVYYDEAHSYVIPHVARCFENSMGFYREFFGYVPSEEVTVLFQDFDDYGYAGTSTIPNNYITLGIEPFEYVYETCPTNERFNWVISHELMHVVASEKGAGKEMFFRKLLRGKVSPNPENPESILYSYLTNPRRYAPRWYHEGLAVFMETWLAGGIGRSLGGYDEMAFRAMVADGAYFYDVVGLESEGTSSDFQIGQNSYLYGTRFMSYLAYHHGPEKVVDWINRRDGTKMYYTSQFRKTFGTSMYDEWRRWIEWEHEFQEANLASVRNYPITPHRDIIDWTLGSVSRGYYDEGSGKLFVAANYPGDFAHIASIDVITGEYTKICDVQTPALYYVTSLAFDEATGRLFYTTNNGKHWRDLNVVDVNTGKSTRLIDDYRTGDLAFNRADRSLWGMQHHNGRSTLVRIAEPHDSWDVISDVMVLPFGRDMFDIDISPDGKWVTGTVTEINGQSRLIRMNTLDLMAGEGGYDVLYEFTQTAPGNFVFSDDGRYLFGTAYESGVSNVFRFDFEKTAMEAVTNTEIGFFRPAPINDDSLVVFRYTSKGFVPTVVPNLTIEDIDPVKYLGNEVVKRHPIVRDWKLGSPREVDLDSVTTYSGTYKKFGSVRLASVYPVVEAYKAYTTVGLRTDFMDPLGLHGGRIALTVSPQEDVPDDERLHGRFSYGHYPWTLESTYNKSDFYDFFGPRKTSRKGYSVSLTRKDYLIADKPRTLEYTAAVVHYGDLEEDPDYQDVEASATEITSGRFLLSYKKFRRSIGGVESEKGLAWRLGWNGNYVAEEFYSNVLGEIDLGFLTPIDHSSIWFRPSAGYSFGERDDSFANFFFGAFGNNYVDHQAPKRFRNYDSFPGAEFSAISGTSFAKMLVEWTLPPWRFEKVGIPILYTTWVRTSLFGAGLITNLDSSVESQFASAGAQLDFRLVLFSGLESMLSVGYANAWAEDSRPEEEFMISLKILR